MGTAAMSLDRRTFNRIAFGGIAAGVATGVAATGAALLPMPGIAASATSCTMHRVWPGPSMPMC